MSVETTLFGIAPDGAVHRYTLQSRTGTKASIITYGARLVAVSVPGLDGAPISLALGFDDLESYLRDRAYFGAVCGRYANRIAAGQFSLDGVHYTLPVNDRKGPNTLHGGFPGFSDVVWRAEAATSEEDAHVELKYFSPHLQNGFPGNVEVTVIYILRDDDLEVRYQATTDRPTPLSLTNHTYWNLDGPRGGNILGHALQIDADFYTPLDDYLIPTGEIRTVRETPLDFRTSRTIGGRSDCVADGYDHNYVVDARGMRKAATLQNESRSRQLEILTDAPGMQLYTGGQLDGSTGGQGVAYEKYAGVVFEPQHFPDSIHRPHFPDAIVTPAHPYCSRTIFRCRWR
jgi:aldose 1-epimerase